MGFEGGGVLFTSSPLPLPETPSSLVSLSFHSNNLFIKHTFIRGRCASPAIPYNDEVLSLLSSFSFIYPPLLPTSLFFFFFDVFRSIIFH